MSIEAQIGGNTGGVIGETIRNCLVRLDGQAADLEDLRARIRAQDWYHDLSEQGSDDEIQQRLAQAESSEGNFWGVGSVVLGLAFFGAKILSPSLCRSTCFLQWGAWLACSICKLLQGKLYGNANHEERTASSLKQCWKEQDGTCPARSNLIGPITFGASYLLLAWITQNCLCQSFSGARNSVRKIFSGARKMWPKSSDTAERTQKCKIGGPKKRFRGVRKVARKMEICTWGQRTEFSQETLPYTSCQILPV